MLTRPWVSEPDFWYPPAERIGLVGDDNEAMEGFRFWKTGYWKDALRGRPYHIRYAYAFGFSPV